MLHAKHRADFCKSKTGSHTGNSRYISTELCSVLYKLLRILRCLLVKLKKKYTKKPGISMFRTMLASSFTRHNICSCAKRSHCSWTHTTERTLTFTKMKNNTLDFKRLNQHGKYSNQMKITHAPERSMSCFHSHPIGQDWPHSPKKTLGQFDAIGKTHTSTDLGLRLSESISIL